jgi:hypothetical protein
MLMQRRNVLFPDPLAPMIDTTSRGITSMEIPFSTSSDPNVLWRSLMRSTGPAPDRAASEE